jgi:hypothetical protein
MKAIAMKESSLNSRAYNPEGFKPPKGKPRIPNPVPVGADVRGYHGSWGLMQVFHGPSFSLARVMRPSGQYPGDLLRPEVNADIAGKWLKDLKRKGFTIKTIDVYNLGETKYAKGLRVASYQADVERNYRLLGG